MIFIITLKVHFIKKVVRKYFKGNKIKTVLQGISHNQRGIGMVMI